MYVDKKGFCYLFCYFKIEEYFKDLIVDNEFEYLYVKIRVLYNEILMKNNNVNE